MEFGMQIVTRGPEAGRRAFEVLADKAEATGLEKIWVSDHLILPPITKGSRHPTHPQGQMPETWKPRYYQPFSVLGFLAARTTRVRLGTSVLILPMRNPIEIAAQVTELDQLSGGRVDLGIGVGWFREEFEAFGYDFTNRGKRMDEAIRLMKVLWADGLATFDGEYHQFADAIMEPKPVQKPHPPIFIGGGSMPAMRRTARLGDGFHPVKSSPERLADQVKTLGSLLADEGRSLEDVAISPKVGLSFEDGPEPTQGSPQDIIDALRRYEDAGATEVCFDQTLEDVGHAVDLLDRFANEVRPKL